MTQWLIPLAILIFFEAVADILAKSWSEKGGMVLAILALVAYVLANTFWLFALRNGSGLGRGGIIFSISSSLIALLLGYMLYGERINTFQVIGICLGLISLVLIFWE